MSDTEKQIRKKWMESEHAAQMPDVLFGMCGTTELLVVDDKKPIWFFCSKQRKVYAVPKKYVTLDEDETKYVIHAKPTIVSCLNGISSQDNFVMKQIVPLWDL